jgi:hypothetical protein
MNKMMPHMMSNLTMDEKKNMMQTMMPMMMKDMDKSQMENMMDTMMPTMMNQMLEKGINMLEMMRIMCPKCVTVATSQASDEDKKTLKSEMTEVFSKI